VLLVLLLLLLVRNIVHFIEGRRLGGSLCRRTLACDGSRARYKLGVVGVDVRCLNGDEAAGVVRRRTQTFSKKF
jgi:hypothetical protein